MKLVLLHSPLVGPGTWNVLAPLLRAHGHDVTVPDVAGVMQGAPPYYSRLAQVTAKATSENAILVVHSGAGDHGAFADRRCYLRRCLAAASR